MIGDTISVIVPIHHLEQYIEKTINSICQQTHGNLEIILIDDGSFDGSGEIIDNIVAYETRITVIHKCNGGVTAARIKGIELSKGDWIGFVDGDDYIENEMYEVLLKNALKYNADISHCGYKMVYPSRVDYYYNTQKTVVQDNRKGLIDLLSGDYVEPGLWNKLIKADLVHSTVSQKLIDTSIKINEDLLMNYYFFRRSKKSVYYDICKYHYILRKGSAATSGISKNKLYDPIKVLNIILNDVKNDSQLSDIVYGRLAAQYINGASMKNNEKKKYIDEYTEFCREELKKLKSEILNGKHGKSAIFKYILCVFSPQLYRWFHSIYSRMRGTNDKYKVR